MQIVHTFCVKPEVKYKNLVPHEIGFVNVDVTAIEKPGQRRGANKCVVLDSAPVRLRDTALHVNFDDAFIQHDALFGNPACEGIYILNRTTARICKYIVITRTVQEFKISDDLANIRIREKPTHSVHVEITKVGCIYLLVIRDQKTVGDSRTKIIIEHFLEVGGRRIWPEIKVVNTIYEVIVR